MKKVIQIDYKALQTDKNKYISDQTFVAVNGYLSSVLKNFKIPIQPQRGQVILTSPTRPFIKGPCYLTEHLCYFRQLESGHLLIGGFRNIDLDSENTNQDQITDPIQNALENFVKNYFQFPEPITITHRWSGIMGFTTDGQMILGEHPELKNIYLMAGCSGHGMGLSFHMAKKLVEASLGQQIPSHLDLRRFFI